MNIRSIVVGGGPMASLIVLVPARETGEDAASDGTEAVAGQALPIRIGSVEAAAISLGLESEQPTRPMTHDLLLSVVGALGAQVADVRVVDVRDTTFFAQVHLTAADGSSRLVDARPSDAVALAVRAGCPIYADDDVLARASLPDFSGVEHDEQEQSMADFHSFVESLSPDDFRSK